MNANSTASGSDLAKVDAYENTMEDYAEIPELDEDFFSRAIRRPVQADRNGPKDSLKRPPIFHGVQGEIPKR